VCVCVCVCGGVGEIDIGMCRGHRSSLWAYVVVVVVVVIVVVVDVVVASVAITVVGMCVGVIDYVCVLVSEGVRVRVGVSGSVVEGHIIG
jgi:hypothetical protein